MKYALIGYGRMGRAIESAAAARGHELLRALDVDEFPRLVEDGRLSETLAGAEVAFEFSVGESAADNLAALLEADVSVVCGTTGWQATERLERASAASNAGWIVAPNFSVGVNLFYRLTAAAARLYGNADGYQPYVVETHHREKRDLPGGTARRLGEIVVEHAASVATLVEGDPRGPLPADALHVTGVRAGSEPGTHSVGFDGEQDVVTLQHRARGRSVFATGAVLAAEWLRGRRGRHGFDEVLDDLLAGPARARAEGGDE